MKKRGSIFSILLATSLCPQLSALEIIFRYDLDGEGFFDQPGAREALEAAAEFYEDLIVDELEEIDPNNFQGGPQRAWRPLYIEPDNGNAQQAAINDTDLVVPANTIIIFAAGRNLSTVGQGGPGGIQFLNPATNEWINQLVNRGEPGATTFQNNSFSENATDFGSWGGSVFFDVDRTWNFSTTDAAANSGIDFLPVALHEIGHVLGIGNIGPTSSWSPLVSARKFEGSLAVLSNDNTEPGLDNILAHWATSVTTSRTLGIFGREHGELQKPLMQSVIATTSANQFTVPTDLDVVALRDIGWELSPTAAPLELAFDFEPGEVGINIPTVTGVHYEVSRSNTPDSLTPSGPEIIGDGSIKRWPDPVEMTAQAFYRVEANLVAAGGSKNAKKPSSNKAAVPAQLDEHGLPILPAHQCICCENVSE